MQYMMLIYFDERTLPDEERAPCYEASLAFAHRLAAEGKCQGAAPLHPTTTATCVRRGEDARPLVTDGPFAETREQLGGYFLIDARDLDEAIAIAAEIPGGRFGTVEIRPVVNLGAAR